MITDLCICHSQDYDWMKELHDPIMQSELSERFRIDFPHLNGRKSRDTRKYLEEKHGRVITIGEISLPSSAIVELGIGYAHHSPLITMQKPATQQYEGLNKISDSHFEYDTIDSMMSQLLIAVNIISDKYKPSRI